MADPVLASAVILGARERVDDVLDEAVADDAEALRYLVQAWKRLYGFYVAAEPDRFRTEQTVTITAPAVSSTFVTAWFSTLGVDFIQSASNNVYIPLRRLQESDRHIFNGVTTAPIPSAYRILGDGTNTNLRVYPAPSGTAQFRHIYIPTAPAITDATTSLDVRNGHDEYLEMIIARRMLKKEQAYEGQWEDELDEIEDTLTNEANLRYMYEPALQSRSRRRAFGTYDAADYPFRGRW